jgi:hypothetical protein
MKINLIAFITLLVASLSGRAQNNDRVITMNNDTIRCTISGPIFFRSYKYSTTDSSHTTKIDKNDVREFYSADKKIWFREIYPSKGLLFSYPLFMKVLERGKISLYETWVQVNGVTNTLWYATKINDTGIYIKTNAFAIFSGTKKGKKIFVTYLADNKPVQDQYIKDDNPDIDEIIRLVHWYNTGEPYIKP